MAFHKRQLRGSLLLITICAPVLCLALAAQTVAPPRKGLDKRFSGTIRPFVHTYCASCHGKEKPQAQLDLTAFTSLESVVRDYPHWSRVLDKLAAKQMPPRSAGKQPSAGLREAVIAWIRAVRQFDAERDAGDPGPVLARRLSNAEYDYTIRDLTGVDLRPTREFPVDPANQEGFDNSGESLTISPALMKKYVQAARGIADHVVFGSRGLEFGPYPMLAETDRDKYCILRIVDFYNRQPTDYADYFHAAWEYRHRAELGARDATLQSIAAKDKVSPGYLELVWNTLSTPGERVGPIAKLQATWNALPSPVQGQPDAARTGCAAMRDWVLAVRKEVAWQFDNLRVPRGFDPGGQCFVLWKDREYASHRRMLNPLRLQVDGVPPPYTVRMKREDERQSQARTITDPVDADLFVPKDEAARAPYVASFNRFCSLFPDAFYISERGRMFLDEPGDRGRLLSAGLHNSMGVFRDDTPLMELILDEKGRQELDRLWLDFDLVAYIPERMHTEFIFYERAEAHSITGPEFNFARSEDKDITSDAKIKRLGDVYTAMARTRMAEGRGEPASIAAIEDYFRRVPLNIRAAEKSRLAAEPLHLKSMVDFARRAYRRPLADAERAGLLAFYRSLRDKEGLTHEDAVRDTLVSILMSPNFLFRLDLEGGPGESIRGNKYTKSVFTDSKTSLKSTQVDFVYSLPRFQPPDHSQTKSGIQPLPDYALASRLSYFLWSSMPDEELLAHAAAGDLHHPEMLSAQSRRMLRDPRVRALALEFGGNWLDFRRFEEHNAVDRDRFPSFNDNLREAMFEEPVRFLMDEFQSDRSVLDMLFGKHTFVNTILARHYGMTVFRASESEWVRVDNAGQFGRGGLLPMAVFLTKNAPGLRTSPVKRGYWVVRRVLGEVIPPPPPTVPELPKDEGTSSTTLRQALEQHRANPACAGCHARFDPYGLVFEGYGPIGERRSKDMGGKPVEVRAPFPGGDRSGLAGLQELIRQQRQKDFLDNLSHKLLSYALGRSLQPSDDETLLRMQQRLAANGYRFGSLVDVIVTSPQFRNRRVTAAVART